VPSLISILLLLTAGVCLQSAISHLIAWFNRRDDRISAFFGLLCLLGCCYAILTVLSFHSTRYESYARLDAIINYCVRTLIAFVPIFLAYYADRKPGWPEKSFAFLLILRELVVSFVPGGGTLSRVTNFSILEHPVGGGPLPVIKGIMGWNGYTLYFLYFFLLVYCLWITAFLFKQNQRTKSYSLFVILLVTSLVYIHDLRISALSLPNPNIGEYSVFLFLIVVGIDLGSRRVKAERNYRTLFHSINDGIAVLDVQNMKLLDINETACRMNHSSRETILSTHFSQLVAHGDPEALQKAIQSLQLVRTKGPQVLEWRVKRLDGTAFWAEVVIRYTHLDGREVLLATIRDVDDRVKARETQMQSDELNKAIVEGFDGYIYICSRDHRIEYMNQRLIDRTGFDATGQTCHEIIHGLSEACPWCAKGRVEFGERVHWETQSPKDNHWFDIFCSPLHRPDGSVSTLALLRDITERKQNEQERNILLARIHQGEKLESLGMLAGGAAHDFNNLLTAILGNADLVAEALPKDSREKVSIEKLKRAARKAAELTKQLLAYSGRGRFKSDSVSINETVREVADMLRISLPPGQRITFNLDDSNPSVTGDPTQLHQVVMNLLTNAAEATEGTQGSIAFATSLSKPSRDISLDPPGFIIPNGPMVLLEAKDGGRGMSEETMKRLFEPFYSTKFAGRGLGMAAVLGIVRSHHGAIQVESTLGQGSTIRIWLPVFEGNSPQPKYFESPTLPGIKRALVVDDEPMVCDAVASALHSLGWQVATANDGVAALEKIRASQKPPDLVFMDMTMPRLDGRQTAKLMKEVFPKIKILMMSGAYARPQDDPIGFSDVDGFLAKPFSIPELKKSILNIIPQENK
jgi:two-component system cell cycle sensor histidine kinase/response regulator CckA